MPPHLHHGLLEAGERDRQLAYWRAHLGEGHPVLDLPFDRPRQAFGEYTAAECEIALPPGLAERIRATALAHDTTPFVVLLAALQAVLYRHSGQNGIRIGITNANRNRPELARLIGFFVNTQVLHAGIDGRLSLGRVLDRARDSVAGAQAHQELPFDVLVEALQPQRGLSHTPLFQVMHNHLRDRHDALVGLEGLEIEDYVLDAQAAKFELTLNTAEDVKGVLTASFTYAGELFDETTIERLGAHYVTVLQALTGDVHRTVADMEILGDSERRHLLEWGQGASTSTVDRAVHERVEHWALATPEATAVVVSPPSPGLARAGEGEVSYAALNARANRLAHRLRALGVGPDVRVGIAMERSVDMVVGLLAILKAGGAYVPLDPTYPGERLAYMVEDGSITVLLTQDALRPRLSFGDGLTIVAIDAIDLSGERTHNPATPAHRDSLAYVIYTSGSTGSPKGVEVTHGAIGRLIDNADYARLDTSVRVLQFAPLAFDASTFEIWGSLCHGGVLVQAPAGRPTLEALAAVVHQHRVDTAWLTAALFNTLVESQPAMLASLRQVITGGETMTVHHMRQALEVCTDGALVNAYGPTECTTFATFHRVASADATRETVPVGRPIGGTRLYVLDADLQLVPQGVTGELYVGGAGLARGYRGRPGMTAERFVANPFFDQGERMYRTGDLVRWNQDGRLEFLGRSDDQVKIRGFRIEPGEIESRLLGQPDVREAVVVVRRMPAGDTLVAYVAAREGIAIDVADLRARLSLSLPDYMMPATIVALPALPLNANGKIDRRSLPDPEVGVERDHEPPRSETERALAAIWSELLSAKRIGREDDFFELGGHSLTAAQMTSRIRMVLGMEVPLREVFTHPVLASLSAFVDALLDEQPATHASSPLEPMPPDETVALSPTQRRLWLAERMAGSGTPAAYNIAAGLRLTGPLDLQALSATLECIAERHDVLRSIYPETIDGDPMVATLPRLGLDLRVEEVPPDRIERELAVLARQRFDLASGPLLRARLLRLEPSRHVLLLSVHHIVFDGWSIAVFIGEFAAIYQALRAGQTPSLPSLPVRYADYASWHDRQLSAASARHRTFWRAYLEGAPALSTWPPDRARTTTASMAGDAVHVSVPRSVADDVARLAKEEETSVFTVMLAAFLLLLYRRTAASDFVVGTDLAGRTHPHLEKLIGFFVNVVPLRTNLTPKTTTFAQWLSHVRTRTLSAFEHADLPFDDIVNLSGAVRSRRLTPLVQTLFVLQNTPRGRFSIPGLEMEIVVPATDTSKFDLGVFVTEDEHGLNARWVYATSLYHRHTIEAAAAAWCDLLQQVVASPTATLDSFIIPHSEGVEYGSNVVS